MAETCFPNFEISRIFPVWPFLDCQGPGIFLSQLPLAEDWEARGLPAQERTKTSRRVADFSIRSILALEGSERERGDPEEPAGGAAEWGRRVSPDPWISCPRLKPPFAPKMQQASSKPRLVSRSPRVPFSATQLRTLERSFQQTRYLSTGQVKEVALLLGLTENRVKIWFQNRRARERRELLKRRPTGKAGVKEEPYLAQSSLGWH